MQLLSEAELIWSAVVANTRMNRERNASGINSYEQEFKFKPEDYLKEVISKKDHAGWLDLCCGQGKALIQVAAYLAANGLHHKVSLKGIDLIETFLPAPPGLHNLTFQMASIVDMTINEQYDLVTCVHGLHYIGDKIKVLVNVLKALTPEGTFIANLDINNIQIEGANTAALLKELFRRNNIQYNTRSRILTCKGPRELDIQLHYQGATDQAGPNYTGQDAVTSYYK